MPVKFPLFSAKPLVLSAIMLLLGPVAPQLAMAQATPGAPAAPDTKAVDNKVYTYVEQMPQLPGGGGMAAVVGAIQSKVVYPAQALQQQLQGRVFVAFTVGPDGLVKDPKIIRGLGAGCDEAVLVAVQQLPQFVPGKQMGKPVPVSFTVPVTFRLVAPAPASAPTPTVAAQTPAIINGGSGQVPAAATMPAETNQRIYTYVEQMPQLPGGGGNKAIIEAIQSHVVYPPQALRQALQGQVFVSFVVGEDGVVRDAKIVKGLGGGCDETVLAAVAQLPRFTPGQQAGRPVAVSYTVPVTFAISGLPAKQRHGR